MAYALVGSLGTVATGTGLSVSPTFGTGESRTAGNLLVCWVAGAGTSSLDPPPSGWTQAVADANTRAAIFYKVATGGDSAPTISQGSSGTLLAAGLAEFSGGATSTPEDQDASSTALTSATVITAASADTASGELVIGCAHYFYSMAGTKTTSHAYNNGGTTLSNANNDGTSDISHYRFTYAITTGNASADSLTDTWTTTNATSHGVVLQSFKLAAGGGGGNPDFSPQGQTGFYGA